MAHFAEVDDSNKVVRVVVADSKAWCETVLGGRWVQTSYNTQGGVHLLGGNPLRKNYAGIGYTYDEARDAFIPPQPFPSWTMNEETCTWEPPISAPEGFYRWDEQEQTWVSNA